MGGLFLLGCGVAVFVCLKPGSGGLGNTIYPWSAYVMALAIALCGVAIVVGSHATAETLLGPAAAVAFASAMQLGGLGAVAVKHWQPAFGMGGGYGNVHDLVHRAWVIVGLSIAAGLVALLILAVGRAFTSDVPVGVRWACNVAGVLTMAVMPLLVGVGSSQNRDATSLGAYALIFALPWGIGLLLAGWLRRSASLWLIGAVFVSALLALSKAWMVDLIFWRAQPIFLVAVGISAVLFVLRLNADR